MSDTFAARAAAYNAAFPDWPASHLVWSQGKAQGVWMMGADYRSKSGYYGSYPPAYLRRVYALFRDIQPGEILHLFSGSVEAAGAETTFDISPKVKPTVVGDASIIDTYFDPGRFRLVLADPPYSSAGAEEYGTPMVNRFAVMKALASVVAPGGYLVWLDTVWPMFRKAQWELVGTIGIVRSTNHRVRVAFIFERRK